MSKETNLCLFGFKVNINIFFTLVSSVLLMILFLFKPLDIKQRAFSDVPLFNVSLFTAYELNDKRLITQMSGTEGTRYSNRFTVNNMDYTDNSRKYLSNMKADKGLSKGEMVYLNGDVIYFREDGLTFETNKANYNKKTSVAKTNSTFVLHRNNDVARGTNLVYNNQKNTIRFKNVNVTYQISKGKK